MGDNNVEQSRVPLWLDCDPGHDDAFAILFAAYHPCLNLLGVSTVHGNASLARTTANAGSVLEAIGRTDIPVHPGAAKPICRRAVHAPNIHGASGLDGTDLLPVPTTPPITSINAILAMRNSLLAQPAGTAWLVATGALTNAALLFATFPEVIPHIKGLSIMGGAIGNNFTAAPMGTVRDDVAGETIPRAGNVSRHAEFNIFCDPEAAKSIFSNPVLAGKTTLIPLDVTHQVFATQEIRDMILHGFNHKQRSEETNKPSVLRQLFHDLLIFFAHTYAEVFDLKEGPPLHDPVAVAVLLHDHPSHRIEFNFRADQIGNDESWDVEIVTLGEHSEDESERGRVGATIAQEARQGSQGVKIPRSLDVRRFWYVMAQCIHSAEEAVAMKEREVGTELDPNEMNDLTSYG